MKKHWTAEENHNYQPPWVIRYAPKPGGTKNADGTTTHALSFPALVISEWVGDPETAVKDIAEALNRSEEKTTPPTAELKTESEWQWWSGDNDEFFPHGPFSTREAAIEEARQSAIGEFKDDDGVWRVGIHVVEARIDTIRFSDWITDADWLIENADERISESDRVGEWDDGPIFEVSAEQQRDLEERIKRACDEWQAAHGLTFKTKTFSHMRNQQHVVVPHPSDDKEAAR